MSELLVIEDLHTYFYSGGRVIKAVEGVSLKVDKGEVVGVVGESGCGKSVTAMSIMRLIPEPPGKYERGSIIFKGRDILSLDPESLRALRGKEIAMIFQEPMTALNPVFTVGYQIDEVLRVHTDLSAEERYDRVIEMMKKVGLPDPEKRYREYPHQLSGGMRQRIMIAMALIMTPDLVIADEPTTALDVTIQRQILDLLEGLKQDYGISLIFISHDMGVIKEIADRVYVMYAGFVVEEASKEDLFGNPLHPYTRGLINSIPPIGFRFRKAPLKSIEGNVPDPASKPQGCPFYPRCPHVMDVCREEKPPVIEVEDGHRVRCFLYG